MTTDAKHTNRQQLFEKVDKAMFDAIAAHRAPAGVYADDADVRDCIERVIADALGRFFTLDLDHDPDPRRQLRLIEQLRQHVLTYRPPTPALLTGAHVH